MKHLPYRSLGAALLLISLQQAGAQAPAPASTEVASTPENADPNLTKLPSGYRDWRLISVAREEGKQDDIRAILGNDIAIKAYREGIRPFPDGAVIARLAWSLVPSEENNKAFGQAQSHVAGPPKNGVQFMFKDSTKYAATGGWGYAQFSETDGKPLEAAKLAACFACHQPASAHDFVFTRYSLAGLAGEK